MVTTNYLPAFCNVHGIVPATSFSVSEISDSTFTGCYDECPVCGLETEVISGVYNSHAKGLNVLLDKSISPEALKLIKDIAEKLQRDEMSLDEAKTEVEKISPEVGKLFDVKNWGEQAQSVVLGSIIGAAALIIASTINSQSNNSDMIDAKPISTIEQVINEHEQPKIPIPKARPKTLPKKDR